MCATASSSPRLPTARSGALTSTQWRTIPSRPCASRTCAGICLHRRVCPSATSISQRSPRPISRTSSTASENPAAKPFSSTEKTNHHSLSLVSSSGVPHSNTHSSPLAAPVSPRPSSMSGAGAISSREVQRNQSHLKAPARYLSSVARVPPLPQDKSNMPWPMVFVALPLTQRKFSSPPQLQLYKPPLLALHQPVLPQVRAPSSTPHLDNPTQPRTARVLAKYSANSSINFSAKPIHSVSCFAAATPPRTPFNNSAFTRSPGFATRNQAHHSAAPIHTILCSMAEK